VDKLFGGWQIGVIAVARRGFAQPSITQVIRQSLRETSKWNCDIIANPNNGPKNILAGWNLAAFATPNSSEVYGKGGRGLLRGPTS